MVYEYGSVAEWSMAADLKSAECNSSQSSNLCASADINSTLENVMGVAPWVLMLVIAGGNGSSQSVTPFADEKACVAALATLLDDGKVYDSGRQRAVTSAFSSSQYGFCLKTASN